MMSHTPSNPNMSRSTVETLKQIQKQGLSISIVSADSPKPSFEPSVSKEMKSKQNIMIDKPSKPSKESKVAQVRSPPNSSSAETRASSSGQAVSSSTPSSFQEVKMAVGVSRTPISSSETRAFSSWSTPNMSTGSVDSKSQGNTNRLIHSSSLQDKNSTSRLPQSSVGTINARTGSVQVAENRNQSRVSHDEPKPSANHNRTQNSLTFEGKIHGIQNRVSLSSSQQVLDVKTYVSNMGRLSQTSTTHETKSVSGQRLSTPQMVSEPKKSNHGPWLPTRVTPVAKVTPVAVRTTQTPVNKALSSSDQQTSERAQLNPFRVAQLGKKEENSVKVMPGSKNIVVSENQTAMHSKVSHSLAIHSETNAVSRIVKLSAASTDQTQKSAPQFDNSSSSTATPVMNSMPNPRGIIKRTPNVRLANSTGSPVAKKKCVRRILPSNMAPDNKLIGPAERTPKVFNQKGLTITPVPVSSPRIAAVVPVSSSQILVICSNCQQISSNAAVCDHCQESILNAKGFQEPVPSSQILVVCSYCHQMSSNAAVCDHCHESIVIAKGFQVVTKKIEKKIEVVYSTGLPISGSNVVLRKAVQHASPRLKGRQRGRRNQEPVILTLSSSDEEEPPPVPVYDHMIEEVPANEAHFFHESGRESELSNNSEFHEENDFDDQYPGVTGIHDHHMEMEDEEPDEDEELIDEELREMDEEEIMDEEDEPDEEEEEEECFEEENEGLSKRIMTTVESLHCRSVRIGSYKVHPPKTHQFVNVALARDSISFTLPTVNAPRKLIQVKLTNKDIVEILAHFGRCLPIMFVCLTPKFAAHLRNLLQMNPSDGRFIDPESKNERVQRLTFLIENMTDDQRQFIRTIFPGEQKLKEVDQKTANEILVRSTPHQQGATNLVKIQSSDISVSSSASTPERAAPQQVQQISITPNLSNQVTLTRVYVTASQAPIQIAAPVVKLMTYPPPPQTGGITVTNDDLNCLRDGEFLNDVIIDFYLKYVFYEKLTPEQREKTHIFSSFFYPRLTHKPDRCRSGDDMHRTMQVRRHDQVKTWTKNVDIFSKDFIIIPVNQNVHWFLAIICYPGKVPDASEAPIQDNKPKTGESVTSSEEPEYNNSSKIISIKELNNGEGDENQDDNSNSNSNYDVEEPPDSDEASPEPPDSSTHPDGKQKKEMPCICVFDSLSGPNRWRIPNTLREYLEMEWKMKKDTRKVFDRATMQGFLLKCPQQTNYSDCGMYLLQYVESFFEDPLPFFGNPMPDLTNWFSEEKITRKRQEIMKLIIGLHRKKHPQHKLCEDCKEYQNEFQTASTVQSNDNR